jgi:hypothetical protein
VTMKEIWIGPVRVGIDAILLVLMGLFLYWFIEPEDLPSHIIRWAAIAAMVLGAASLAAYLALSAWSYLRKSTPKT